MYRSISSLILAVALPVLSSPGYAQTCPFTQWTVFRGVTLYRTVDGSAYAYKTSHLAIDADGAPNAYCPGNKGLDLLGNANYPNGDWADILVQDPKDRSKPYAQKSGPAAGCFVAKTSLSSSATPETDVKSYVDATSVPYMVFPPGFIKIDGTGFIGDVAVARSADGKHTSAAIVGDSGGAKNSPLGEISIRLAENLGGKNVSPRTVAKNLLGGPVTMVVFRQSYFAPKWPVTNQALQDRTDALLRKLGGWEAIDACTF
jgi:hypothetical protein